MVKYSIIICTYNRYNYLKDTIESICEAVGQRVDCELLIIDNNSTDQTPHITTLFERISYLRYMVEPNQGLSHARNRGMKEALGEILVYLDDDIGLPADYFDVCDGIFGNPNIVISGGKVLPYMVAIPDWLPEKYYYLVSVFDMGDNEKFVRYLLGANFAIRKCAADKIGEYDTRLGRKGTSLAGGEETDYQNRARRLGYEIFYHPKQNIFHKINEKLNESYVLRFAYDSGVSERIIDGSLSMRRVWLKYFKSHLALLLFIFLRSILKTRKLNMYLRIINQFGRGYMGYGNPEALLQTV